MIRRRAGVLIVLFALVAAACSEPLDEGGEGTTVPDAAGTDASDCSGDRLLECARLSTIGDLVPDEPEVADGEPVRLGMVNQENTPGGSYPELSLGVRAAIDFVNDQLGGLDGRPIELEVCNTQFSAEGSTACGQRFVESGLPVVMGGIDVFGTAIDVLGENGIAYAGGIPVSSQSVEAENSYQWSGGSWGASVAFAEWAATELDAGSVAIVYGEFGSIEEAAEYGRTVLERNGVEVQMVPYPILATDIGSPLQAAATNDPDAIAVLAADAGCSSAFEALANLDLDAQPFFTGACAAPTIVDSVDATVTDGAIFNVEGPIANDPADPDPDLQLYNAVIDRYGDGVDAVGAATVTFRAFMNLYAVLRELGAAELSPGSVSESLASQVDTPSFMGHPYTCDREQFEGLPAICSPQQILGQMQDRQLDQISDWIDVGRIYGS